MVSRKKIDEQLFEKFQKNKKKLIVTGGNTNTWFWRTGEIQYAQFSKMDVGEKQKHLQYLLSLLPQNRSTNDDYILKFYGPAEVKKQLHYFSIDDNELESVMQVAKITPEVLEADILVKVNEKINKNIDLIFDEYSNKIKPSSTEEKDGTSDEYTRTDIPDENELIKDIPNMSKQDIKELICDYYANEYPNWEIDLYNTKIENFINNTNSIFHYTSYIIGLLTTYKKM